MLPQKNRITGNNLIEKLKNKGKAVQSKNFTILFLKRKDKKPSRFAFVVSTKISKKAVERNKVKRRLRHVVSDNLDLLKKEKDVLVLVKRRIVKESMDFLKKEIGESFNKINQ